MVDGVERNTSWGSSPLYEEVTAAPLLVSLPDVAPGTYGGLTSAIDLAPTVLDLRAVRSAVAGQSARQQRKLCRHADALLDCAG